MKKKLYVLTLLFSGYLFAQQEELVNTTWYLEKLILEGEDHFLPQNEEVSQSQLYVDSSNSYFSTDVGSCAGGMSEGLDFPEENYFTIDNFYVYSPHVKYRKTIILPINMPILFGIILSIHFTT